ncbi:hypothetical protein Adt_05354 [Abeliophyllum distichum]|uniref:Secreted protein n=1 Tax=Abeliophyllum distichum TaxID=126358 RepID=A0ABD1V3W7_9LAMI
MRTKNPDRDVCVAAWWHSAGAHVVCVVCAIGTPCVGARTAPSMRAPYAPKPIEVVRPALHVASDYAWPWATSWEEKKTAGIGASEIANGSSTIDGSVWLQVNPYEECIRGA